jgi:hypothetical protein
MFIDDKWESPLHGTRAKLGLKINTAQTYTVNIGYTFKAGCIQIRPSSI